MTSQRYDIMDTSATWAWRATHHRDQARQLDALVPSSSTLDHAPPLPSAESNQTQMGIKGLHPKGRKRRTSDRASQYGGISGYSSQPWLEL